MTPVKPVRPAWTRESAAVRIGDVVDLAAIDREWAWGGATGRGVRVAVVDSGIETTHPMLGGRAVSGVHVVLHDGGVELVEGPHDDAFGHGTACAGIIHTLAPDAEITSVRVLDDRLRAKAPGFLAALEWAIDQRFDLVNLSLGTVKRDYALAFHDLCDRAYFESTLLVTAANNMHRVSFPSLYASVASVACNLTDDPWRFHYNPEPPTEFLARGIDVEVAWRGGGTSVVTGNSYAAPHIAGVAARILSKHPGLRPFQVKTVLWACATNVAEASHEVAGRMTRATMATRATAARRQSVMVPRPSTQGGFPRT